MPGFVLHAGASVLCAHAGQARVIVPDSCIAVSGQPVAMLPVPWLITGCALPGMAGGPCVSAQFVTASIRVTSRGQPLLLSDSRATCVPTGTPLQIVSTQTRVSAT